MLIAFAFFPCFQVVLSRLPVGHTHEDIDQKFSIISRVSVYAEEGFPRREVAYMVPQLPCMVFQYIGAMNIMTPEQFKQAVISAFSAVRSDTSVPVHCYFNDLWAIWDWGKWFTSQGRDSFPNEIGNFAKRDEAVMSARFRRRKVDRQDRP